MYGVELYAAVRLAVVDEGLSHHEAGRRFGIDRRTVKKMLSYAAPPGYRRTKPVRRPKLDGFTGIVDAILVLSFHFFDLLQPDTRPCLPRTAQGRALHAPLVRSGESAADAFLAYRYQTTRGMYL